MKLLRLVENANAIDPWIQFYHGGPLWRGRPEVRTAKGRYECGPGIYLTTSYNRARSYAGGSRVVQLVSVDASRIRFPDSVEVSLREAERMLGSVRIANRSKVLRDLKEVAAKRPLTANVVVNLLVNHEALAGNSGPAVAEWLTELGVTADVNRFHSEQWLIVFDPSIITRYRKVDPKTVTSDFEFDLPMKL